MNYLELCQRLRQECGVAGTGPTDVTTQTGELKRLVDWIKDEWTDIQNSKQNWRWMQSYFTLNTVASTDNYSYGDATDDETAVAITRFKRWILSDYEDPPKIYLQSSGIGGQTWLTYLDWEDFRAIYKIGSQNSVEGQPAHITVDPRNRIFLGPIPNDIYVIQGGYQKSAQVLAADGDEPEMPEDFHMLIVWQALRRYALRESASELLAQSDVNKKPLQNALKLDQLPRVRVAGPMA